MAVLCEILTDISRQMYDSSFAKTDKCHSRENNALTVVCDASYNITSTMLEPISPMHEPKSMIFLIDVTL